MAVVIDYPDSNNWTEFDKVQQFPPCVKILFVLWFEGTYFLVKPAIL